MHMTVVMNILILFAIFLHFCNCGSKASQAVELYSQEDGYKDDDDDDDDDDVDRVDLDDPAVNPDDPAVNWKSIFKGVVPGTKWCGNSNVAKHYHHLGKNRRTDICCRTHDHCRYYIGAWKWKYGLWNRHPYAMLHCDCNNKFRSCLKRVNSIFSNSLGYGFFHVQRAHCIYQYRSRYPACTRRHWGICTGWGWRYRNKWGVKTTNYKK